MRSHQERKQKSTEFLYLTNIVKLRHVDKLTHVNYIMSQVT